MKTRIARWGNSLAVRLPADVVRSFGLREGQQVELQPNDRSLEIRTGRPVVNGIPVYTLDELVDRMEPANEPELLDFGPAVGSEIVGSDPSGGTSAPKAS